MLSSPPATPPPDAQSPAPVRARAALLGAALLLVSIAAFAVMGQDGSATGAIAAHLFILAGSLPALVYILSAVGLGVLFRPLFKGLADEHTAQVALGLSLQFTLSHLLGWSGLLSGRFGLPVALVPIALGLILGARQGLVHLRVSRDARPPATRFWDAIVGLSLFSLPAVAILLVAACNPPAWLWASEFGGYDALSYHLQLPQEWLATGRLSPLTHNVYSFLPSYFESAFMHVAVLTGAPANSPGALLAHDGRAALASQILHALTALACALLVARVVRSLTIAAADPADPARDARARHAGALAGGLLIATPWVIVVGSLAYNEMAMCTLFIGALAVAADRGAAPIRRWVIAAWLVGVASGIKPTALTFAGIPVAIMLLGTTPARSWLLAAPAAIGAGLLALAPWLVRNSLAGGNPVFPYLSPLFGTAHWTSDQAGRYLAGHHAGLNLSDRLRLLILPDPGDPAGPRHRGLLHPQWAAFFPLVLASVGALLLGARPLRRSALLLSLGLLSQVALWLTTTHLQSRFLLPLAVPGTLLFGLAVGALLQGRTRLPGPLVTAVVSLPVLIQGAASAVIFLSQQRSRPNEFLTAGPAVFSGEIFRAEFDSLPPNEREAFLATASPEIFCNFTREAPELVYLLGDSTPFYFLCPILYHTTWDTSPLGAAIRAAPGNPDAWTTSLRARGITHVLYNPGEIGRLTRSGWYDPEVTTDIASRWLESSADLVRPWPQQNRYLFRLR